MRDSGIRDIQTAAEAAAELKALRGDGARRRKHREVATSSRGTAGSAAPIEVNKLSLLMQAAAEVDQELAAIHETITPLSTAREVCPCDWSSANYLAIGVHLQELPEEQYRATMGMVHEHIACYSLAIAAEREIPVLGCLHPHIDPQLDRAVRKRIEEGIRRGKVLVEPPLTKAGKVPVHFKTRGLGGNTVIPEYVLPGGRDGVLCCVHPSCIQPDGQRRRLLLEELLEDGLETLVTLKDLEQLWGFSQDSMRKDIGIRAEVPVPDRGTRPNPAGAPSKLFRLGDVIANPRIARRLAASD
jgi:hypothetical protein